MKNKLEKDIKEKFKAALKRLYEKEGDLLELSEGCSESDHAGEQAIMFMVAHHLQNLLDGDIKYKGYRVDCEYNRHIADIKRVDGIIRRPDIIVHQRKTDSNNLLVVEVKGYWNPNTGEDIEKLEKFTDQSGEYRYSLGVSVIIAREYKDLDKGIIWVKNGKEEE